MGRPSRPHIITICLCVCAHAHALLINMLCIKTVVGAVLSTI